MGQWNKIASSLDPLTERIMDTLGGFRKITQATGLQVVLSKVDGVVLIFPLDMDSNRPNKVQITKNLNRYELSFFASQGGREELVSVVKSVPESQLKKVIENKTDLYLTI